MVYILCLNFIACIRMFPTSIMVCENRNNFLPCIVQFDWLISDQLRYLLNIYRFDCFVLRFPIENCSNKSTKSTSCFIFLFDISKIMKSMKKNFEKGHGRYFPGDLVLKPGDWEN